MKKIKPEIEYLWDALNVMSKWLHSSEFNAQGMYDEVNLLRLEAQKARELPTLPKRKKATHPNK